MNPAADERLTHWLDDLHRRHLSDLTFAEVRRALQALSARYVARRSDRPGVYALDGAGKRAAFAMFFGPLHLLVVHQILAGLDSPAVNRIVDLGCGTGSAGAAWSLATGQGELLAVDRNAWAIGECTCTFRALGIRGRTRRTDLAGVKLPGPGGGIVAAYTVNELLPRQRDELRERLLEAARRGTRVLIVEPIARRISPWWDDWSAAFQAAGGRDDRWRFPTDLPPRLAELDHAAGLDHRELTARSLFV